MCSIPIRTHDTTTLNESPSRARPTRAANRSAAEPTTTDRSTITTSYKEDHRIASDKRDKIKAEAVQSNTIKAGHTKPI